MQLNESNAKVKTNAETILWEALNMETFGDAIKEPNAMDAVMFGTGHTVNSCYHCDNSHSMCSAGEANCNPRIS